MRRAGKWVVLLLAVLLFLQAVTAFAELPLLSVNEVLTRGSRGESVTALQSALLLLGFYHGEPSGIYDTETVEAVKLLQRALGVRADGAFGPATQAAYNAAVKEGRLEKFEGVASNGADAPLFGIIIGIDAGHQKTADRELEKMGPNSKRTKAKMSAGATGIKSGTEEYVITLSVAQKLETLLTEAGAIVVMTRTENDVLLSNRERAELMNESGVTCWVRIHCDAAKSKAQSGASVLVPSRSNSASIYRESLRLGKAIFESFCRVTEAKKRTISARTDQTGFNWSDSPVIAIEMGYLSNVIDDAKLNSDSYQDACAQGIYEGLLAYFHG